MAGNRRKRRRACAGKRGWPHEGQAKAEATRINNAKVREKKQRMQWLSPYRCRTCGLFHIGHRNAKRRADRLIDLIDRAVAEDQEKKRKNNA